MLAGRKNRLNDLLKVLLGYILKPKTPNNGCATSIQPRLAEARRLEVSVDAVAAWLGLGPGVGGVCYNHHHLRGQQFQESDDCWVHFGGQARI